MVKRARAAYHHPHREQGEANGLAAVQAVVREQRQAKRAAETQRMARQAARKQDKKLMQQLKAAKGTHGRNVC